MEKQEKLVSVIIPVFNVGKYFRNALDSIISQTYNNWELLLVDDGSNDGSLEIAQEYCEKDRRIHYYQRERLPKGAPTCRNIGFENAKGEYLIYLDSDDIIAPYCFQQRVEYIEKNDCDFAVFPLVGYYHKLFDADGMIFGYKPQGDVVYNLLSRSLPFVVVSNIYKRESLQHSNIVWDTSFKSYQDSDYNLQAIRAGLTFKISNLLPDYFYRLSAENSICKKLFSANNCLSQVAFLEKQTEIYGGDKQYYNALLICAALIYQNILLASDKGEVINQFLTKGVITERVLLAKKLRLIARLSSRIKSLKVLDIFQLLLVPVFFLRYKMHYFRWTKHNSEKYKELEAIFQTAVSSTVKSAIVEKL